MKSISRTLLPAAVLFIAGAAHAAPVSIQFRNSSEWDIQEMYLSPTGEESWGPDQLGQATIPSGSTFTLRNIPVGDYDFKIVDEDEDECIIEEVTIADDEAVEIDDDDLLGCQAES